MPDEPLSPEGATSADAKPFDQRRFNIGCLAIFLGIPLLMGVCTWLGEDDTDTRTPAISRADNDSAGGTLERDLATIDGARGQESVYASALNAAEDVCAESRQQIGDMAARTVELIRESGSTATTLDVIRDATASARTAGTDNCQEMFGAIAAIGSG